MIRVAVFAVLAACSRGTEAPRAEVKTPKEPEVKQSFSDFDNATVRPLVAVKDWSKAIAALRTYLADQTDEIHAARARNKINQIDVQAMTEWMNIERRNIGRLWREGKSKEAVEHLGALIVRYEGTVVYGKPKGIKAMHEWLRDGRELDAFFK